MGDCEIKTLDMTMKNGSVSLPSPTTCQQGNLWTIDEVPIKVESETQTSPKHHCMQKSPELRTVAIHVKIKNELKDDDYNAENPKACGKNYHEIQPLVHKKTDMEFSNGPSKKRYSVSKENLTTNDVLLESESVSEAYSTLFFSCFNFLWSIVVACWHLRDGCIQEGICTVGITFFGGVVVEIVYLANKNIRLKQIWKVSKIIYFLNLIPCLTPLVMSSANTIFALKEARSKSYRRPWYKTRIIFLTEALSSTFLQCVIQTCILMEDKYSIPSLKGFFVYFGIIISTVGIAFARIRFDGSKKFERFGKGVEKLIRVAMIWSYKVLWILTLCTSLVVIRINFPNHLFLVTIIGFIGLQLFFELQVLLSTSAKLRRFFSTSVGLFFLIPQFSWLVALITWVNYDRTIYETYIGSIILGSFFYAEFICLAGWLSDSCRDKETDFVSFYPHFFGNLLGALYSKLDILVIVV